MLGLVPVLASEAEAQFLSSLPKEFCQDTKIGGYVVGRYTSTDDSRSVSDGGFDIKQARVSVDGKVMDFSYRVQVEASRATGDAPDREVRLIDAFVEWGRYPWLKVKAGEFHRCFTFENPYNPWDIGFDNNAQVVNRLAGGRDIGLQLSGDLLPAADGHCLVGYQLGVFNGQGMNLNDKDKRRDVMGGLSFSPFRSWTVGLFGWKGSYVTDDGVSQGRNLWAAGIRHEGDWTLRGEYAASNGHDTRPADGWYATVGVPAAKGLKIYAKWDVYRDGKTMSGATSQYDITANCYLCRNLKFQLEYFFTHKGDALAGDRNFNTLMAEVYCRF